MAVEKPRPSYRGLPHATVDESIRKRIQNSTGRIHAIEDEADDEDIAHAEQQAEQTARENAQWSQEEKSMPDQESQQREEPFGAQVLRRLHSDGCTLMQEYDEMMKVTEHPQVRRHLEKRLGHLDELLTNTETLFKKNYKDFPPLGDEFEDEDDDDIDEEEELGKQGVKSEYPMDGPGPRLTAAQRYRQEVESGRAQPWYRQADRRQGARQPRETAGNDFRPRAGEKATYPTQQEENIELQRSMSGLIRDEQNTNDAEEMVHRPPLNRLTSGDTAPPPSTNQQRPNRKQGRKSLSEVAIQQAKDIQELTKTLQIITSKL